MKTDKSNQEKVNRIQMAMLIVSALLIVVAAVLLFIRETQSRAGSTPKQLTFLPEKIEQNASANPSAKPESDGRSVQMTSKQDGTNRLESEQIIEQAIAPSLTSAARLTLQSTRYGTMVPVSISFQKLCGGIDRQKIQRDSERSGTTSLLLTIEQFAGARSAKPLVAQRIPIERVLAGATFNLTVPNSKKKRHLGLFVCSDPSLAGSCKGKKAGTQKSGNKSGGLLYYFGYIVLEGDKLSAPDPALVTELPKHLLRAWVRNEESLPDNALPVQVLELIRSVDDRIRPLPLDLSKPIVQIEFADCDTSAAAP